MKWEDARRVAREVSRLMQPFCERLDIAGSIRRCAPEVKDIEIVCIPRMREAKPDGFLFQGQVLVNELHEQLAGSSLIRWIKPGTPDIVRWPIRADGKYWRGLIPQGTFGAREDIKLDVFLARPENYGVILVVRTGSADFSRELVTFARDHTEYRVDGGMLKLQGGDVPCPDERVLFDALGLRWIDPTERHGEANIVRR